MKTIITAALLGALSLGTASIAAADHDRRNRYESRYDDTRILGSKWLRNDRGRVEFDLTPGLRRDGLMLVTDGRVGIRKVQFVYSDGRVETLKGRKLARMAQGDGSLVIQTGRPPGLRHVRVWYRLPSRQRAVDLDLVSFGDGYTSEEDLYENRPRRHREYRDYRN